MFISRSPKYVRVKVDSTVTVSNGSDGFVSAIGFDAPINSGWSVWDSTERSYASVRDDLLRGGSKRRGCFMMMVPVAPNDRTQLINFHMPMSYDSEPTMIGIHFPDFAIKSALVTLELVIFDKGSDIPSHERNLLSPPVRIPNHNPTERMFIRVTVSGDCVPSGDELDMRSTVPLPVANMYHNRGVPNNAPPMVGEKFTPDNPNERIPSTLTYQLWKSSVDKFKSKLVALGNGEK
jgi:hypothetical protein